MPTLRSAKQFPCECNGDDVACVKFHDFANSANSVLENLGPLSLCSTSQIPLQAKCVCNFRITVYDFVSGKKSRRNANNGPPSVGNSYCQNKTGLLTKLDKACLGILTL
ncbi:hypothetical protein DPMN_157859 [Dreissena polymorpha]|uniref:Uncharacterized protein n=1 Tax=Dreissena polymorpha TaxID=45954 RepID=A0A9D4IP85_DREPO|nr:hypothetical protein DPMN_157859 [Dreissena polymorpha]